MSFLPGEGLELNGMHAAVAQSAAQRPVDQLMLLDEGPACEGPGPNGDVEMIHRAGSIDDLDLGIGNVLTDQRSERVVVDHGLSGGRVPRSDSDNPRASRSVSGRRSALLASIAATPEAATMPVTPTRMAGTPRAWIGPMWISKLS